MKSFVGVLLLSMSVAVASDFTRGENLISTFTPGHPDFENYQAYIKSDSAFSSHLWVSKEFGKLDTFKVDVRYDLKSADLLKLQNALNKPGIEDCKSFSSNNLSSEDSNGFPQLSWETFCDLGDKNGFILHKAISGRDSLYLIRKFWYREVAQEVVDNWKETLAKLYVCDTRGENHPCPEGYTKMTNDS